MNDDDEEPSLDALRAEHRRLDDRIEMMRSNGSAHQMELARLKKRKLKLKDRIQQLQDQSIPDIIA